ncbi:MAG: DnaJ domain-containing protein [Nitrospinaceae bacterium]
MLNFFQILNLNSQASFEEVKKAYKIQVKRWHPDRFPVTDPALQRHAHEKFQQIADAFRQLEKHFKARRAGRYADDQPAADFQKKPRAPGESKGGADTPHASSSTKEHESAAGFFTRTWPNGDLYEGQMVNGMMQGMGIFTAIDGSVYTGQFRHGKPNGQGKLVFENGDNYTGEFFEDRMEGKGTYIYANGDRYIGQFKNDLPHGQGAHILASGKVYAGLWENGYLAAPS